MLRLWPSLCTQIVPLWGRRAALTVMPLLEAAGQVAVRGTGEKRGLTHPGRIAGRQREEAGSLVSGRAWHPGNLTRSPMAAPGRAPVQGVKDDPHDEAQYEDQHVDHCPSRRVWLARLVVSH